MASIFSLHLLSAAVLVALLMPCASGVPLEDSNTDSLAGDTSGEEEEVETASDLLSIAKMFKCLLDNTKDHKKEFEEEFHMSGIYPNESSLFPTKCPDSNFSKEACFQRLAQGLLKYTVLLKHVEREYSNSLIISASKRFTGPLIEQIKQKMKNRALVVPLTTSQEEQLLKDFDNRDAYHRKLAAQSIIDQFHWFLNDGKRSICRREPLRVAVICRMIKC